MGKLESDSVRRGGDAGSLLCMFVGLARPDIIVFIRVLVDQISYRVVDLWRKMDYL